MQCHGDTYVLTHQLRAKTSTHPLPDRDEKTHASTPTQTRLASSHTERSLYMEELHHEIQGIIETYRHPGGDIATLFRGQQTLL